MSAPLTLGAVGALAGLAALSSRRGSSSVERAGGVRWEVEPGSIWMHPLDFLAFTSTPADSPALRRRNIPKYRRAMETDVFPGLWLEIEVEDGYREVRMHDGRHRAIAAHQRGEKWVPVKLAPVDYLGNPVEAQLVAQSPEGGLSLEAYTQVYDDDEIEDFGYLPQREMSVPVRMSAP